MNIFLEDDYRLILAAQLKDRPRGFQTIFAKAIGCQASYLIQVVKGKADLKEEQALSAANFLGFSRFQRDYFLLLVGKARAATPPLRSMYMEKISAMRQAHDELKNRAPGFKEIELATAVEYFSHWDFSTIHVATSVPHLQTIEELAARFKLDPVRVKEVLSFLHDRGLVIQTNDRWVHSGESFFIPRESVLNNFNQMVRREQGIHSLRSQDKSNIHFGSIFTMSAEQFEALKGEISDSIEKSLKKIGDSPSEEVYSLVIDFFKVV